tara:strand:+ start:428 stop:601 length:174 start_codon:yes stop_codon:yes gene_type:complete
MSKSSDVQDKIAEALFTIDSDPEEKDTKSGISLQRVQQWLNQKWEPADKQFNKKVSE